uniref:Uncharacterized protein n=1 Tax=Anguilla anguilla TaxID=7936 RepID=A0A0E9VPK7_ANGAN
MIGGLGWMGRRRFY